MTGAGGRRFLAILLTATLCLLAQSSQSRDGYRAAYKAWREADPVLERDAGAAGAALTPRTEKAAEAAAAYGASRLAFLRDLAAREAQNLQWLQAAEVRLLPDLAPAPELIRFTTRESNAASTSAATFANDPDRAIQQLRQAFERERAALEAVRTAIGVRQKAEDRATKAALTADLSRTKALEQYSFLASALSQSADLMSQETAVWAAYYPALAEASRPPAQPVSSAPAPSGPASTAPVSSAPASAPRVPSVTPLPLSRYVGVWAYQKGDPFHGPEPESVDLSVHEQNGHASGTLSARFKLPPGSKTDPVLRFEFSGDFRATRSQTFALQTADGAMGAVELIPGGPFNVLEVNFETEAKAGKIDRGDVLLVKQ
jgi:hypothetical protein